MRDVLHCQRELEVLLRTEASGIQPHNALLHTHGKDMGRHRHASTMHQPQCVKIHSVVTRFWFGLFFLIKKGICLSVCGVYESLF